MGFRGTTGGILLLIFKFLSCATSAETECDAYGECEGRELQRTLRSRDPEPVSNGFYDIYDCPDKPPKGYPRQWSANDVFGRWNPNSTEIPDQVFQGLCIFDFSDYQKADNYLQADVPFVMRNTPDFVDTAARWNRPGYIDTMMEDGIYPVHKSQTHSFKYWTRKEDPPPGWEQPTEVLRIPFGEYKKLVYDAKPDEPHYYLYSEGYWSSADEEYRWSLFDELPRFKPDNFDLYHELPHQNWQKLHCKFGMAGNMAALHFDSSRNTIVLLKGRRRYILADPTQCPLFELHEEPHPSNRHTRLEWTEMMKRDIYLNELVLQQGDALILPSYWFHSIIGLTQDDVQCNAWSIGTLTWKQSVTDCGEF